MVNIAMTGSVALPADDGGRRVVVVLHHADDPIAASALKVWAGLSDASHLSAFMCVAHQTPARGDDAPLPPLHPARLLCDGEWESVHLLEVLHGLGELSRVDILAVCTSGLEHAQQAESAAADAVLRHDLRRIMPDNTQVSSHRVWIPHYGDEALAPDGAFVRSEATSAVVVLPVDRQFERAAAMPVSEAGPDGVSNDVYAWHVAVEVASLGGLWSTMDCAPVEFLDRASDGLGRPLVRLARSMVRAARIHTPSPDQPLGGSGMLPLTPGMLPAPDSAPIVRAAAPHIYPAAFRALSDATVTPSRLRDLIPSSQEVSTRRLAAEAVDTVLDRGDDVADAASRLDDFIADTVTAAPWTEPLASDASHHAGDSSEVVAESMALLDRTRPPVTIEAVPVQAWEEVLDAIFGLADAKATAEEVRASAASGRYVIVDPHALAPDAGELLAAVAAADGREPKPAEGAWAVAADGTVNRDANDPLSVAASPAEPCLGDTDEDAEDAEEDSTEGAGGDSTLDSSGPTEPSGPDETPLLVQVTRQFDLEIERSQGYVQHHVGLLHDELRPENRPEPGVTNFVVYALLASVLLGIGSLLTLTGWRELITPDRLGDAVRVATFLLVSLAATLPPVLRLTPSRNWSAQVRLTIIAVAYAGAAVAVVVTAPIIEESFLDRPGQWLPAVAVVSLVMILAIVARARDFRGDRALLGSLAALVGNRTATAVPIAYGFVMLIAALNQDSTAPPAFENRNWRLLVVLLAVAIAGAITSATLIRLVRSRDKRQAREWRQRIDDLVNRCELGSARTAALRVLKAHWLTMAAVVARLLHRPFGSHRATTPPNDPAPAVRKLLMFDLQLTDETRDLYLGELLPELAPRGWLREQFRRMSSQFTSSERTSLGYRADGHMPPPEHDTYPMSLASVERGEGRGARWRFAERVFACDFDSLLHETAKKAMNSAMAATFMTDEIGVSLGPASADRRSLPQLLGEMLPAGEERFPAGTLPPSPQPAPDYQSQVWWPAVVAMPEDFPPLAHQCEPLHSHGTVLFHAVRVDISEPVSLERLKPIAASDPVPPDGHTSQAADEMKRDLDALPDPLI